VREDETELQWALRLDDMIDTKSEEFKAKYTLVEELEEAIKKKAAEGGNRV
jgi:hypothetical protein